MARSFRPGDVVRVRSIASIMRTLDETGSLDGLPFMPEMLPYIGKRFRVANRVVKICNLIDDTGNRAMPDAVYLDDLRCDGCHHGGCDAECRFYWKDDWLEKADGNDTAAGVDAEEIAAARQRLLPHTTNGERYRCQATEALKATTGPVSVWQIKQYWDELANGNVTVGQFLTVALRAIVQRLATRAGLLDYVPQWLVPHWTIPLGRHERGEPLMLKPGDWVEVRSAEEIARTLNAGGKNLGLFFSHPEMLPLVGKRFRVRRRVRQIIDEKTGRMLKMKHDCFALEGGVCHGDYAAGRWFCARQVFSYWREAWLKKVDGPLPGR